MSLVGECAKRQLLRRNKRGSMQAHEIHRKQQESFENASMTGPGSNRLKVPFRAARVPKTCPRVEATPLFSVGHYDGVCSGIAEHQGRLYWFSVKGTSWYDGPRRQRRGYKYPWPRWRRAYMLYPLTFWEAARELAARTAFVILAGHQCSFNRDGSRRRRQWPWCNWLWPFPIRIGDWLRGSKPGSEARDRYEKRDPIGYFLIEKR